MECTLYLTDFCNLSCSYCYQGDNKKASYMAGATLQQAIRFIVTNNIEGEKIDLTFLGGEPLLNQKSLFEAIRIIQDTYKEYRHLFQYHITTNGILLNDELIDFFKINDFSLSISIDGNRVTHNLNRVSKDQKDYYDRIVYNIACLINRRCNFAVRMTIAPNNAKFLFANIQYFFNMGVQKVRTGIDHMAEWTAEELMDLDNQLELLDEYYLENIAINPDKILDLYDYKMTSFLIKQKPLYCSAGTKSHLVINSQGELFPCGYVTHDNAWKIGSVDTSLESRRFYAQRCRKTLRKSECHSCELSFTCCGAKCGFLNYISTGYLNMHHERICRLERIVYKHNYLVIKELFKRRDQRLMKFYHIAVEQGMEFTNIFTEMKKAVERKEQMNVYINNGSQSNM